MPPSSTQTNEALRKHLHDLAGSLTVLTLNLPELKGTPNTEAFTACQSAIEQARMTLKYAWKSVEQDDSGEK